MKFSLKGGKNEKENFNLNWGFGIFCFFPVFSKKFLYFSGNTPDFETLVDVLFYLSHNPFLFLVFG